MTSGALGTREEGTSYTEAFVWTHVLGVYELVEAGRYRDLSSCIGIWAIALLMYNRTALKKHAV